MDYKAMIDNLVASEYYEAMGPLEVTKDLVEQQRKRSLEVKNCNHLFVVTKDEENYETIGGEQHYSAPTVECVHCGISNRLVNYHNRLWNENPTNIHSGYPFEGALFLENFESWFKDGKVRDGHFDKVTSPFLSNEVLYINNAKYWYDAAKNLKPEAPEEELFKAMKYLINCYQENIKKVQMIEQPNSKKF